MVDNIDHSDSDKHCSMTKFKADLALEIGKLTCTSVTMATTTAAAATPIIATARRTTAKTKLSGSD